MAEKKEKPIIADPLASNSTDTDNLSVMADTQTRKTVKLKPIAAPNEHERKTVLLKNIAGEIDKANVVEDKSAETAPAAEVKPESVSAPAVPEAADDDTVKIQRPVIAKKSGPEIEKKSSLPPGIPEKSTIKLTPPKAGEDKEKAVAETVKLTPPKPALAVNKTQAPVPSAPILDFVPQSKRPAKTGISVTLMLLVAAILFGASAALAALQYFA